MSYLPIEVPAYAEVTRAARALRGAEAPVVLGYHPVARMNPFQALLYRSAFERGFAPVPLYSRSSFESLAAARRMGARPMLHLHWTSEVLRGVSDVEEARNAKKAFLEELGGLRESGVDLIWTVHNVLPHDCGYAEVESELRADLASIAMAVHVMNPRTREYTQPHYPLPDDRTFQVPHPSYLGAYPNHMDARMVRFDLGFEPDDLVVGVLGSIQAYKGIGRFLDALDEARLAEPRLRSLVAGIPGTDAASQDLVMRLEADENILSVPRRLDDGALARLLTALDALVLPYDASLNSGAALLGITFGLPIVAPRLGQFEVLEDIGLCRTYEPTDPRALVDALSRVGDTVGAHDNQLALDYASETRAEVVSTAFFQAIGGIEQP